VAGCGSVKPAPDGGGGAGGGAAGSGTAGKGGTGQPGGRGGSDAGGGSGGATTGTAGTGGAAGTDGTGRGGQSGTDGARGGQNGAKGGTGGGAAGGTGGVATGGIGGGATGGTGGIATGGTGGGTVGCQPACDQMHTCVGTACLLNAGLQCTLAAQCASNTCTPFYQDLDGDGYGAGAAAGFCGTTAPVGYATKNGDCCDDPNHLSVAKLIHPNADFQMTSAGGVCNVTWDYDCSGKVDKSAPMYGCDPTSAPPNCRMTTGEYADSTCGMSVAGCGCGTGTSGTTCSVFCQGTMQTCK
jgi:hypothetical protein